MRFSPAHLLVLLTTATGCGTIQNLRDRPNGPFIFGTGCCYPMGGTVRSGTLALFGPPVGVTGIIDGEVDVCRGDVSGFKKIGHGMGTISAGLIAVVDIPLSFVGDILTLPVVHARTHERPWATWWGEESMSWPLEIAPQSPVRPSETAHQVEMPK